MPLFQHTKRLPHQARIFLLLAALLILTGLLNARNYFVDNHAEGPGKGTIKQPWTALADSIDFLKAGDTLFFRGDTAQPRVYDISLTIKGAGGDSNNPIVIMPFHGEHVLLRGDGEAPLLTLKAGGVLLQHLTIDQNDVKQDAILIRSANNIIRHCIIRNGRRDGIDIEAGGYNLIEHNEIYGFNSDTTLSAARDAHGIVLSAGRENIIRNNRIYDNNGDCIQVFHGDAKWTRIIDNELFTTLGSISENAIDVKSCSGLEIRGNRMHGFRRGHGSDGVAIVIHHAVDSLTIAENIIRNCNGGIRLNKDDKGMPRHISIRRNLVYGMVNQRIKSVDGYGMLLNDVHDVSITNNTLVGIPGPLFIFMGDSLTKVDIRNNLFYMGWKIGGMTLYQPGKVQSDYNGWFRCSDSFPEANPVSGPDPGFRAPERHNYRLAAKSPAIDAGDPASTNTGQNGERTDLGAFEYSGLAVYQIDFRDTTLSDAAIPFAGFNIRWHLKRLTYAIDFSINRPSKLTWEIFSISGKRIFRQEQYYRAGRQRLEFLLRDVPAGIYILRVQLAGRNRQFKILVL